MRRLYDVAGRGIGRAVLGVRVQRREPAVGGGAEGTGALWERVLRTYDPMGNLLAVEGELSGIRVEYQYRPDAPAADPHTHELYKATWMLAGVAWHTVTHGYDAEGRRVTTTVDAGLPGSHAQAFAYDEANRLLAITNDGTTQASFAYASGFLVTTTLGNGNRISRTYDAKGRLESLEHATAAGKTLAKIVYGYDKRDRRTTVQYPHLGITSTFTYTDNSWLASESHAFSTAAPVFGNPEVATYGGNASAPTAGATVTPAPPSGSGIALSISYTYDERGNRKTKDVAGTTTGDATYLYDLEDRLLSESRDGGATTVAYAWANRGDMVGRTKSTGAVVESETFVTDYLARITAYSGPDSSWNYIYAPTGDRIAKKKVGGGVPDEWSLPDGGDVIADYTKLGSDPEEFTGIYVSPGTDGRLARINARGPPTFYFGDSLNSVHQMSDADGLVTGTNFTDAWGNDLGIGLASTSGPGSRYGFTGRENDKESGLMHYRARSYDSMTGRFTSRDPVPPQKSYHYVDNSPVNFTDPLGLWKWKGGRRQGTARATMIPEEGDTTTKAALFTRMEASESEKWLKDSTGHWVKPDEKINMTLEYDSPNTVVIAVGKALVAKQVLAIWQTRVTEALENRGFNVDAYRYEDGTKMATVETAARDKDVWGLAFFGHGKRYVRAFYDWRTDTDMGMLNGGFAWDGDEEIITPASLAPPHKFGLMIEFTCYAEMQPWFGLVSETGKYFGGTGFTQPLLGPTAIDFMGTWDQLIGKAAD